ncbi:MAG: CDP-alcohol phosphatidyltransferase family protein [Rhodospirillaceae bacterium]|nr:CDP-alcohol phosphatidyltransferase family protein [Rhodospirillales bacterium]
MAFSGLVVGDCTVHLWGITGGERARRTLANAGAGTITSDAETAAQAPSCLMVRADWVVDPALIGLLAKEAGTVLATRGEGQLVPLAAHVAADDVAATTRALAAPAGSPQPWPEHLRVIEHDPAAPFLYLAILRKRLKPVVMPLTENTVAAAERATFTGAYKGITDVVTKYLWPVPARWVTRWCAQAGLTPNAVTLASLVLVFVAMALFAQGSFLAGLAAAWIMTFLDTVDGKLARVTLTSTRFGNFFDHGIDLIHPPFWWLAWHWGCIGAGVAYPTPDLTLAVTFAGYVVLRLLEGAFVLRHGFQIHVWRRVDSRFRLVVARRNPNLIVLTIFALVGLPGWGLVTVAIWTAISIAVHAVQLTQAELSARRGGPLASWLAAS